jgi:plasmid stabilization system protein ParE
MTATDVLVLRAAVQDLEAARRFYDRKEPGVGQIFWDSLIGDITSLIDYAGIHGRSFGVHRMLAKRFPYAIYYRMDGDVALVIAVLPLRRNPEWLKRKMRQRS